MSFVKLAGTAGGTAVASSPLFDLFNHYVNLPVWGVPVTVIGAAAFGTALSLFFGDPVTGARNFYGQILAATVFGAAIAGLSADALQLEWAQKNMAIFALMTAAMTRWFLPSIIERGKLLIKDLKLPSVGKSKGDSE